MKQTMRWLLMGLLLAGVTAALLSRGIQFKAGAQEKKEVTLANFKFEPKTLTVTEGETVTWTNKEGTHTVKSDAEGAFGSKTLKAGESFSHQFAKAGKYPYYCSFHGSKGGGDMAGTIVVVKKK